MSQVLGEADIDCSSVNEAAARSHSGCLQSLLKQPGGATAVLQLDDDRHTPLHVVRHGTAYCAETTAALIGSLTQQQQRTAVVNRLDSGGHTALRRTVEKQGYSTRVCHGCLRLLLAAGADVIADEWQPDILGEVTSVATMCDDSCHAEQTVQALVQRGLDVEQRDSSGLTRLQQLAQSVTEDCSSSAGIAPLVVAMRALLANGADALAADNNGNTSLHFLVSMIDKDAPLYSTAELMRCINEPAIRAIYDSAGAACLAAKKKKR
jgi:hypothetical protein